MIDERFAELVAELRTAAPTAPPEVRARVREIAARPPASPRRQFRLAWVLAPAAVAAVAGAIVIVIGVGDAHFDGPAPQPTAADLDRTAKTTEALSGLAAKAPVAPGRRAQLYTAGLTLRVGDLSGATQGALRTTRRLGGYIRSIDYGSGTKSGTADLVLRVPIGRVQQAIVSFSGLGKILDQHVSVRDAQPTLDRRFAKIVELRRKIPWLSGVEREQAETELRALQQVQARDRQRTRFATVSLRLQTKEAAVVTPTPPGRIERALRHAGDIVAAELAALLYACVVAAPFFLLGGALLLGVRARRRRIDARLLA